MDFIAQQQAFMDHIRDPERHPEPPGMESRRLAIYRRLFFNNVEGFLASAFPVLKSLYDQPQWQALVRRFYADHDCKSPLFLEISQEFLDYLDSPAFRARPCDPPFIKELAHYEWLELEAGRAEEEGALLDALTGASPLRRSAASQLAAYHWPVHQIGPDFVPQSPGQAPVFLLVYRDLDDTMGFSALNPALAQALEWIGQQPGLTPSALAQAMAAQFPAMTQEQLLAGLLTGLTPLAQRGVLRLAEN